MKTLTLKSIHTWEGEYGDGIRYYRNLEIGDDVICNFCHNKIIDHGWIEDTDLIFINAESRVCPRDTILRYEDGKIAVANIQIGVRMKLLQK